jgi:hypothetical protein
MSNWPRPGGGSASTGGHIRPPGGAERPVGYLGARMPARRDRLAPGPARTDKEAGQLTRLLESVENLGSSVYQVPTLAPPATTHPPALEPATVQERVTLPDESRVMENVFPVGTDVAVTE